ncbi:MAG: hypothetical protein C0518_12360 [Opitutus sp.]|nr:hypothetical protein [Opitutus sp.]
MIPDFPARLRQMADVLVRVGVNLQPRQPLLISEPYEQQGVARSAEVIVEAVRHAADDLGSSVEVIWSDGAALRAMLERDDRIAFQQLVRGNVRRLQQHVEAGGALMFLTGSQPRVLAGLPAERLTIFNEINWRQLGPLVQQLVHGATQWTLAPAPSPTWAALTFADLPGEERLTALWRVVFDALRVDGADDAVDAWRAHLAGLEQHAARLNSQRAHTIHYEGDGTDLTIDLPRRHHWCTAQLTSAAGVPFVVNLPTEEIFTAPDRSSAEGVVRVARPVVHAGTTLDGIELEFRRGRVVRSSARTGGELLAQLLATDDGADRLGEVALLASEFGAAPRDWQSARPLFHHPLLDENAACHVALGEAYPFCHRGWWKRAVNRSLIHVDLPLAARVAVR